jgi:hypothetical protein
MRIDTTPRGFSVVRFDDSLGRPCTLQKSSLADEDCIWLGRDDGPSDVAVRMHLTQGMAARIVDALGSDDILHGVEFKDRYGSACVLRTGLQGLRMTEIGIVTDFEGRAGRTMALDLELADRLSTMLRGFVETGSVRT